MGRDGNREERIEDRKRPERDIRTLCALCYAVKNLRVSAVDFPDSSPVVLWSVVLLSLHALRLAIAGLGTGFFNTLLCCDTTQPSQISPKT